MFSRLWFGLQMAVDGILQDKMRSSLTVLGVLIGVASVVTLIGIGQGAREAVAQQFESLGTNVIRVETNRPNARLQLEDAGNLQERVPFLQGAMPVVEDETQIEYRRDNTVVPVMGVSEDYPDIRDHEVAAGRFIGAIDVQERLRTAVVGWNLVDEVFGGRDPRGHRVYIGGEGFTVIGVLSPKGEGMADNVDDKILVPVTSAQRVFESYRLDAVWAKASSQELVDPSVVQIQRILIRRFGPPQPSEEEMQQAAGASPGGASSGGVAIGPGGRVITQPGMGMGQPGQQQPSAEQLREPVFEVTSMNELIDQANEANRVLSLMLSAIAAVSLLVGGLGIMNIMLVSVSERTQEIGLRKAVGARRGDLVYQFMLEALMLSLIGGVLGIVLGITGIGFVDSQGISTVLTPAAGYIAFVAALLVGLVFGVYPAFSAAGLQPVEALRRE